MIGTGAAWLLLVLASPLAVSSYHLPMQTTCGTRFLALPMQTTCGPRPLAHARVPVAARMMAKAKSKGGKAKGGAVQVVLHQPVKGVGKKGEVVTVKPAYAENVILRAGLGALATPEVLDKLAAKQAADAEAAAEAKAAAVANDKALTKIFADGCVIAKNVGPDGAIFGSVTATEIADALDKQAGIRVEKKDIKVPDLKHVGSGTAEVRLHKEVVHKLKVVIVSAAA